MLTLRAAEALNARSLQELVWRCGSTFCSTLTNDYTPGEEGQEQSSEDSYIDSFSLMPSLNIDCTDKDFFNGKVIAFTGEMYNMLRSEAIQAAENLGAIYKGDSISRKTQILVIGKQDMHRTKGSKLSSKQKKPLKIATKDTISFGSTKVNLYPFCPCTNPLYKKPRLMRQHQTGKCKNPYNSRKPGHCSIIISHRRGPGQERRHLWPQKRHERTITSISAPMAAGRCVW